MEDAGQPNFDDVRVGYCPRCLQPVPPEAKRCPNCRQPVLTLRMLPWGIAAACMLVLVIGLLAFGRMARREARGAAPAETGVTVPQEGLSSETPPPPPAPTQPAKPEKPPPLNEQ